jgi:serine/threonine protein kinase
MLVGHTPFKSQAKKNMLINISMCKPKFPLSFPPLARDLISKMLLKSTSERLKISEITSHAWISSISPMKETFSLKYSQIPLPSYHGKA